MSFIFGGFDTATAGHIATLKQLPSLAGLKLDTLEAPGSDGLILGGTSRGAAQFTFDVIVRGDSAEAAAAKREAVALALDPARGEQDLTFDAAPGWRWVAICSKPIGWDRVTWDAGAGYQLRADVTFDALEGYGRLVDDESWTISGTGSRTVTRTEGNARSFPTVEVTGTLTSSQSVTVTVADVTVKVSGPLSSSQVLRLDWDKFDFARWAGASKAASAVGKMSTFDRPELWPGVDAAFKVASTGTVGAATLYANSRRQ